MNKLLDINTTRRERGTSLSRNVTFIQLMHPFEVNIRTNPDVNLKRMHQLYNVTFLVEMSGFVNPRIVNITFEG